ncbi:MAG: BON domain-containing protein [Rhodospirillales bacterium]|nr:BON domain-containing protein [Alphaproteobacteria bacterium]MCB9986265.1 BON domain-containing protein [Rhodospirillales bacterium]USO07182.1 MAG: BON domain-containing protein [Rhodospirillales bacterium]
MYRAWFSPFLVFFALVALSGCTPLSAGVAVGSAAGVSAAHEGGIKASLDDTRISATIHNLWFQYNFNMFTKVGLTVDQGRVLLTGVVQKPEYRVDAVRLAWQAPGVRQVINEIKVANSDGISGWARDAWITSRLRTTVLFDKNVQGINYSFDTVQGVVYIMGVAQNQAELDRVLGYARSLPYVRQVVSYVKLAGQPMNQVIANGGPNAVGMLPAQSAPIQSAPVTAAPLAAAPVANGGMVYSTNTTSYGTAGPVPLDSAYPNANVPMTSVPNPPRAGVAAPGRPAPIVDSGF